MRASQRPTELFLDRGEIEEELRMRDAFFAQRLARQFSNAELRDVTNVVLATSDSDARVGASRGVGADRGRSVRVDGADVPQARQVADLGFLSFRSSRK